MNMLIAESLSNAEAAWIITGLGAVAFITYIAVGVKKLFFEKKYDISPQPLLVALEKEFVARAEYERRHNDLENQVKDTRKYSHDELHNTRNDIQAMKLSGESRDHLLHTLDERTQTHTQIIRSIDVKVDAFGKDVHSRINDVLKEVSSLRGSFEQSQRRLISRGG